MGDPRDLYREPGDPRRKPRGTANLPQESQRNRSSDTCSRAAISDTGVTRREANLWLPSHSRTSAIAVSSVLQGLGINGSSDFAFSRHQIRARQTRPKNETQGASPNVLLTPADHCVSRCFKCGASDLPVLVSCSWLAVCSVTLEFHLNAISHCYLSVRFSFFFLERSAKRDTAFFPSPAAAAFAPAAGLWKEGD